MLSSAAAATPPQQHGASQLHRQDYTNHVAPQASTDWTTLCPDLQAFASAAGSAAAATSSQQYDASQPHQQIRTNDADAAASTDWATLSPSAAASPQHLHASQSAQPQSYVPPQALDPSQYGMTTSVGISSSSPQPLRHPQSQSYVSLLARPAGASSHSPPPLQTPQLQPSSKSRSSRQSSLTIVRSIAASGPDNGLS